LDVNDSMATMIALDAMGGDHGPSVVIPAALSSLNQHDDLKLILVGDSARIEQELKAATVDQLRRIEIQHSTQVVAMDEPPAQALRSKKDSSMRVAINMVKDNRADACVSAGNTGALMATARYVLHTLLGIDRPAINSTLPAIKGHTHMLDLGANVDCSADNLFQFAVMGSVLAGVVEDIAEPKVGLLNVGSEAIKGNEVVKSANKLLENSALNYIGFVEGDDIFCGDVDVVVCDGFVGNVALKTTEGVARLISNYGRQAFNQNIFTKIAGFLSLPALKNFKSQIDPRRYNGASLLGLRGIVIKSHGGADAFSFAHAISLAHLEAKKSVPTLIDNQLERFLL